MNPATGADGRAAMDDDVRPDVAAVTDFDARINHDKWSNEDVFAKDRAGIHYRRGMHVHRGVRHVEKTDQLGEDRIFGEEVWRRLGIGAGLRGVGSTRSLRGSSHQPGRRSSGGIKGLFELR
jgi:hypothetical protein